jgi:hypothetical protein
MTVVIALLLGASVVAARAKDAVGAQTVADVEFLG